MTRFRHPNLSQTDHLSHSNSYFLKRLMLDSGTHYRFIKSRRSRTGEVEIPAINAGILRFRTRQHYCLETRLPAFRVFATAGFLKRRRVRTGRSLLKNRSTLRVNPKIQEKENATNCAGAVSQQQTVLDHAGPILAVGPRRDRSQVARPSADRTLCARPRGDRGAD
jgi:hypothetical protein